MNSKHLVGELGKTTTGERVAVIVYPNRLKRLKSLAECVLETQKNFGKGASRKRAVALHRPESKIRGGSMQRLARDYRSAEPSAVPRNAGNYAASVWVRASGLRCSARFGFWR